MNRCRLLLFLALLCGPCRLACAGSAHHLFWTVRGAHNIVYLLGSVHMLKPGDDALPPGALAAYADSQALVLELDLSDLTAGAASLRAAGLTTLPSGETLAQVLDPQLYGQFRAEAVMLGMDPGLASRYQPWFAAVVLEQLQLTRSGFDPGDGIDERFARRAQADGKPVIGLETLDQQLGIFAGLSLDQQRQYLRETLKDAGTQVASAQAIVGAWQRGDSAALERLLRQGSRESPGFFRALMTDRNRRWLVKIDGLLQGDRNYLVVVGALHMIGHDGVVEMLRQQGYPAVQH